MQLHVLGPVEASADGRPVSLGGPKPRAVLVMLGLEANRILTADQLIEGLWGERPPASASKLIQTYVWRLRTALGEDAGAQIVTRARGYELRIDPECVDARRFERLLAVANRADEAGEPLDAAREALNLWRGPALADLADEPFAAAEIRRLEELRIQATELAIAADLAAGRHREAAAEIDVVIAEHPLRERLHAQRMLALYRCGRQADALEAYRQARRMLVDEIGVEPGRELQRLHEAILRHDPSLELVVLEFPRHLDAAASPPLVGRDAELAWLRAHWQRARAGAGALLTLAGARGSGKTRLAAELAGEAHREGASVLYVADTAAPEQALTAVARARHPERPTLLVLDDCDRAAAEVRATLGRLAPELSAGASLVVVTGQDARALGPLRPTESLDLGPLDADGVREIAALYAPGAAELPVATLLAGSDGVPRRVHEVASKWARREAERRVDQVAARAAAGRSHTQELEAELAGSVVDLQSTREAARVLGQGHHRDVSVVCPYKGLAPFEADDVEYFFGRERLVAQLVARLVGAPLLAVVGPSGSGKSSVIRAGLLPALAAGVLPGSERWTHALIRPGRHPLRELSRATSRRHGGRQLLLVVDQFEEVFTACADERERSAFIEALVGAARGRERVALAVRADFYGRCAAYPGLSEMLGANHVLVGPMTSDELSRAIELPARRAGLRLEPGLADRLLADCEGEPGALPLLSTALLELWQQRDGRDLRLAGYERTGGVRGAVAGLAESAYARLDAGQRMLARRILLRLAGEDVQGVLVRRRVALEELDSEREDVARVLDVLTDSRMITTGDGAVEVAHEALLREWPRLRGWLDEDREGRRVHRRLSEAAREWTAGGHDRSELYRGGRLASALEWRAEHDPELNAAERRFLDASQAAGERARRRTRLAFAGVLGLLVIATAAALIALDQRGQARAEARAAEAQRLSVQALSEEQLDRSLLLARQAVALDDSPTTRDNLLAALRGSPAAIAVLRGDGDGLNAIDVAPDGRTVAIGDSSGTVMFWDAVTRRQVGARHQNEAGSEISAVAFSPDGTRLATAGSSAPWGGFVDLFDGRTRRHIGRLTADRTISENVVRLSFSRDSRMLAAQTGDTGESAPLTRLVRWDARTGRLLADMRPIPGRSSTLLGFTSRGRRVVTSSLRDRETVVRDAASLRPLRRFRVAASVAAMNATEDVIAFGSRDGSLRLLDLRTGGVRKCRGRHEAPVSAIRFSADRRHLVSAGRDERLIVWDATCAAAIETLSASHRGVIVDVAVARDGRTAYTASRDGTAIAWDLTGERRWERAFDAGGAPRVPGTLTTAARADALAFIDAQGFVDIFDTHTLRRTAHVRPRRGRAVGAALAPAGATLGITTDHGELELWDTRARRRIGEPQIAHAFPSLAVTFSADGRWLATGDDPILRLWDARHGSAIDNFVLGAVADLSFSPSGTMLAATHQNTNFSGGLEIRAVPDLHLIRTVPMPLGTIGRFSQDGRSLIYAARDGRVWMLDTTTWRPRGRPIKARPSILTADLSADGRLLATTSTDGTGTLWDVASRRPIGASLSGASSDPIDAAFLRGGTHLAVVHEGESVIWDVRPRSWTQHACAVAGRRLTRSEWENALPRHNYAPTCHDPG